MLAKLYVCTSDHNCGGLRGSKLLLQDIEELSAGRGCVVSSSCVDHCGKGPNVEVLYVNSTKSKVVIHGVNTFDKALSLVQAEMGLTIGRVERQVAKFKYDARRSTKPQDSLSKVQKAFRLLGGEAKAIHKEARHASDLLVMRCLATISIGRDLPSAIADAQRASELRTDWARPQFAAALAFEALKDFESAWSALDTACSLGLSVSDSQGLRRRLFAAKPSVNEQALVHGATPDGTGQSARPAEVEAIPLLASKCAAQVRGVASASLMGIGGPPEPAAPRVVEGKTAKVRPPTINDGHGSDRPAPASSPPTPKVRAKPKAKRPAARASTLATDQEQQRSVVKEVALLPWQPSLPEDDSAPQFVPPSSTALLLI